MTIIDEERLRRSLHDAAETVDVTDHMVERALAAARTPVTRGRAPRLVATLRGTPRRRRLLVAAAALVAGTAIALPLLHTESTSPRATLSATGFASQKDLAGAGSLPPRSTGLVVNAGVVRTGSTVTQSAAHGTASPATTSSAKIMSTGRVELTVARGRIDAALSRLSRLVARDHGSVVSSQVQSATAADGNFAFAEVVLQVPQPMFQTLVAQAQAVGDTTRVTTTSIDVTGQYVDLRARIAALVVGRRQYLAILTRAMTISDILAVQGRLNSLQSRIEQLQGQLNLLDHQTTYATLALDITERGHHAAHHATTNGVTRALRQSVHGFVAGVEWLIRSAGPALFAVLCLGVLWLLGRWTWRSLRRRSL